MKTEPISIKEALADESHPAHEVAKDLTYKLEKGEISMCACIGPLYGEPYCGCEMERRGLPLNMEAREADMKQFKEAMDGLFKELES